MLFCTVHCKVARHLLRERNNNDPPLRLADIGNNIEPTPWCRVRHRRGPESERECAAGLSTSPV